MAIRRTIGLSIAVSLLVLASICSVVISTKSHLAAVEKQARDCGCFVMGDLQYVYVPRSIKLDDFRSLVATLKSVRRPIGLRINGCHVDDEVVRTIGQMHWLISLDMADTNVTDRHIEALSGLEELESLRLLRVRVSDAALPTLNKLTNLRDLNLEGTDVSESMVRKVLVNLPYLDLEATVPSAIRPKDILPQNNPAATDLSM